MNADFRVKDREDAMAWANDVLGGKFMILDTETTGLRIDSEIVQIAVLGHDEIEWVNTLIKCRNPHKLLEKDPKSGLCAFDIHGIHPDMLTDAPTWADVHADLYVSLMDERVIIFNSQYDWPLIEAHCNECLLMRPEPVAVECAMLKYSAYYGEWNEYRQNYKWQRLPAAPGVKAHDAMGDCISVLHLIKKMAGIE